MSVSNVATIAAQRAPAVERPLHHPADRCGLGVERLVRRCPRSVGALAGRGGWTWCTGSAAWLCRAGVEALLGFHLRGDHLLLDPCIPATWTGPAARIPLRDDRQEHRLHLPMGVHAAAG